MTPKIFCNSKFVLWRPPTRKMYGQPCKKDIGWVAISVMEREGAGAYGPTPAPACHIIHVVTPESNRVFTVGMGGGDEGRGELLICSYPFAFQELHNRRALSFQCFERRKSFIEYLFR